MTAMLAGAALQRCHNGVVFEAALAAEGGDWSFATGL